MQATADNADAIDSEGSIEVADNLGRDDAGPLLADAKSIAILGDSFSSGEGAGDYLNGTDTAQNHCHRSHSTYLVDVFDIPEAGIIACSGAVSGDLWRPNKHGHPAQVTALDEHQQRSGPADAVLMTLGGNDMGFETLLKSCLTATVSCADQVQGVPTGRWRTERATGLADRLVHAYKTVDDTLNQPERTETRGRRAPIIVLAYPRILPGAKAGILDQACSATTLLDQRELVIGSEIITQLNGIVEGAVTAAHRQGVPVFFVDEVEDAFLPGHTICDGDRAYVRSLETVAIGPRRETLLDLIEAQANVVPAMQIVGRTKAAMDDIDRRLQEVFHPNVDGYAAISQAVLRWSRSDEADGTLPDPVERDRLKVITSSAISGKLVVNGNATPTLQPGSVWQLQAGGFAPGSPLEVTIQSTLQVLAVTSADEDGNTDAVLTVPGEIEPGRHALNVHGFDTHGAPLALTQVISVDDGLTIPWRLIAAGLAVLFLAIGLYLFSRKARNSRPVPA